VKVARLIPTLAALALVSTAGATLRPIDVRVTPVDNKSVAVFKNTPQGELKINLYFPKEWRASDRRPAIVFFFGGGFVSGTPAQFTTKAEYFASRGMVAASAEYRIGQVHHTEPHASIEDAKSAVRWLRLNARSLGIDPDRVLAGGGSAGATCAAYTAYNTSFEPMGEDMSVSSQPNALVLFNPAFGSSGFLSMWDVIKGGPPAILFFGTEDDLLPPARDFVAKMKAAGNRVELYTAAGQKHGFFNDRGATPWHALTVRQTDLFLTSLGYLQGPPEMPMPDGGAVLKREIP
jgi:acetyl esterase